MQVQEKIVTYGSPKPPKTYTLHEYLLREERSISKNEFHNGQIVRMPGSNTKHNIIATNVTGLLHSAINQNDLPFTVLNSDQKIYIAVLDKVLYPDVLVVFETPEHFEDSESLLINPLLIVEVASKSTKNYDRSDKFMHYRMLPTLKEYVLIEQNKPQIETFYLERENTWNITKATNLDASIHFRSIGVAIDLQKIYKNVF